MSPAERLQLAIRHVTSERKRQESRLLPPLRLSSPRLLRPRHVYFDAAYFATLFTFFALHAFAFHADIYFRLPPLHAAAMMPPCLLMMLMSRLPYSISATVDDTIVLFSFLFLAIRVLLLIRHAPPLALSLFFFATMILLERDDIYVMITIFRYAYAATIRHYFIFRYAPAIYHAKEALRLFDAAQAARVAIFFYAALRAYDGSHVVTGMLLLNIVILLSIRHYHLIITI